VTANHALVLLLRLTDPSTAHRQRVLGSIADGFDADDAVRVYTGAAVERNPLLGDRYGVAESDFDVVFEARYPMGAPVSDGVTENIASRLLEALVEVPFETQRSIVAVGSQHVVAQEDDAALHVHYALHRTPTIDTAEFRRAWMQDFSPIVQQTPTQRGYRQVHVDRDASRLLGTRLGIHGEAPDGIACGYFDDGAALIESSTWAQAHPQHRVTLERFVDLPRSRSILSVAATAGETTGRQPHEGSRRP
jgi:hypothetical protein